MSAINGFVLGVMIFCLCQSVAIGVGDHLRRLWRWLFWNGASYDSYTETTIPPGLKSPGEMMGTLYAILLTILISMAAIMVFIFLGTLILAMLGMIDAPAWLRAMGK